MTKKFKVHALIVLTLTALAVAFAPATEAAELRMKVRIDEPFEINGQLYEPAVLTLRHMGRYNPTTTINEVWVGNQCLGQGDAASPATRQLRHGCVAWQLQATDHGLNPLLQVPAIHCFQFFLHA